MSQIWRIWEMGRKDSASPKVELGKLYEVGLKLGESYEDCLELEELFFKLGESYELLLNKRGLSVEGPTLRICMQN